MREPERRLRRASEHEACSHSPWLQLSYSYSYLKQSLSMDAMGSARPSCHPAVQARQGEVLQVGLFAQPWTTASVIGMQQSPPVHNNPGHKGNLLSSPLLFYPPLPSRYPDRDESPLVRTDHLVDPPSVRALRSRVQGAERGRERAEYGVNTERACAIEIQLGSQQLSVSS